MTQDMTADIADLQQRLLAQAQPQTKAWWEAYLKQALPFRGVNMALIRKTLHAWHRERHLAERANELEYPLALLREVFAEDKLAGILYLQEILLETLQWQTDLPKLAAVFADGAINDWNTCDWLCVKVLGPLAERQGEACARAIATWHQADTLWQRRAAGVAFVNLAPQGDNNFAGFTDMLLEVCASNVRDPERFAQTGTGWVLRALWLAEPERVEDFIGAHLQYVSSEGLRYATEKMPPAEKRHWRTRHRVARAS